jgi:hypothetical protein
MKLEIIAGFRGTGKTKNLKHRLNKSLISGAKFGMKEWRKALSNGKANAKTLILDSYNEYSNIDVLAIDKIEDFLTNKKSSEIKRINFLDDNGLVLPIDKVNEIFFQCIKGMQSGHLIIEASIYLYPNKVFKAIENRVAGKCLTITCICQDLYAVRKYLSLVDKIELHWSTAKFRGKYFSEKLIQAQKRINMAFDANPMCFETVQLSQIRH